MSPVRLIVIVPFWDGVYPRPTGIPESKFVNKA